MEAGTPMLPDKVTVDEVMFFLHQLELCGVVVIFKLDIWNKKKKKKKSWQHLKGFPGSPPPQY